MVRKTKEDAEKTKESIIRAAEDLFYERGVVRTSLHEVAIAAGVTRGAVYWHFRNKVDLLLTIADSVFMPYEELLERLLADDEDEPLVSLHKHSCQSLNAIMNDPRRRRIFTILTQRCEYIEEMDELIRRNNACRDRLLDRVAAIFEQAHKKKALPSPWKPQTAAVSLHSMLYGFVHMEMEWSKPSRKRDNMRNEAINAFFATFGV